MDSSVTQTQSNAVYRERLLQAKRVLQGLTDQERVEDFCIGVYALASDTGVRACIAGLCGFDPWFQERGFITTETDSGGQVSMPPEEFFGTARPFYPRFYSTPYSVTVDDAISALDEAIDRRP